MKKFLTLDRLTLSVVGIYVLGCALSNSLMSVGAIFLIVLGLVSFIRNFSKIGALEKAFFFAIVAFISYQVIRLLLVPNPFPKNFNRAMEAIPLFLIPALAVAFEDRKKTLSPLLYFLPVLYLIASCTGLVQALVLKKEFASGFMGNPIMFANNLLAFYVLGVELCFRRWKQFDRNLRMLWVSACFAVFAGILFSVSRSALFVAAGFLILRFFLSLKFKNAAILSLGFVFFAGILGVTAWSRLEDFRKTMDEMSHLNSPDALGIRGFLWKWNLKIIHEHPVFGVGMRQNAFDVRMAPELNLPWAPGPDHLAHNIYLQLLAEGGIVALVLGLGCVVLLLTAYPWVWPFVLTFALSGMTESLLNYTKVMHALFAMLFLWILWGRSSQKRSL